MANVLQISCVTHHYYPETSDNFKKLCRHLNLSFQENNESTCCGLPYFEKGELKAAKTLAEYNLQIYGNNEIICSNAKCLNCYEIQYPKVFNNTVSHNSATQLAKNSKGLGSLFQKLKEETLSKIKGHYFVVKECQCNQALNEVLNRMPLCLFSYPALQTACCGAAGSMASENTELARALGKNLILEFEKSGADAMLFEDDICRKHIDIVANNSGIPVKTLHIIDLIAQNLT